MCATDEIEFYLAGPAVFLSYLSLWISYETNTKYKYKMSITRRLNRAMGHLLIYIFNFITSSSKREGVSKKKRFYKMFFVQMFTFPVQCHFFAQLIVSQCQCIGQVLFPLLALHWCTLTQGNILCVVFANVDHHFHFLITRLACKCHLQ